MRHPPYLPALALLLLPFSVAAQTESGATTPATVNEILQKAIIGERAAQIRYTSFADKAAADGYLGAASLFHAAREAEIVHEKRFSTLLKDRNGVMPEGNEETPVVGTTQENLSVARENELAERDRTYHDMNEQCLKLGDKEAASALEIARTAESEHANLLMAALWNLDGMKESKTFWVCSECGFTSDVKLPHCPSCRKQNARMKAIE